MRILLIEDNRAVCAWLANALRAEKYVVDRVGSSDDARHLLEIEDYAVVLFTLSAASLDGLYQLAGLRSFSDTVPIIVLSADASARNSVSALNAGADDHLAIPFDMSELSARIRVQLRRRYLREKPIVSCGPLAFDRNSRHFSIRGEALEFTGREHAVLETLMARVGATIMKHSLVTSVFGFADEVDPNAVEVYVHRIRKKLDGSGVTILTRRGLGYSLRESSTELCQAATI